tara:strand:- start:5937 stop:6446 length:510 start_codon:yes stop_codon:yes gene_type:complete
LKLSSCTKELFVSSISESKEDAFAKTFVSKADWLGKWELCVGVFNDGGELMSAIITTVACRKPFTANLQLLHTFHKHRGCGAARMLCEASLVQAISDGARYFRVSSEIDSVGFYTKIGFMFWGKQKSGCSLSIFRIEGDKISDGNYDYIDPVIYKAINRKGRGGCVELY